MIQIITYDIGKYKEYSDKQYKISKLGEIQALDDFEICVIDLTSEYIWRYDESQPTNVNCHNDLLTIKEAIINSNISKIVIVLPQNEEFYYYKTYKNSRYVLDKFIQLKDNKENLVKIISSNLFNMGKVKLTFEKTRTTIENESLEADFNFNIYQEEKFEVLTFSNNSKKVTTIKNEKIFITTLKILDDNEKLKLFIENYCKNTQGKEDMPDWISDINFFNDEQLKKDKDNNLAKISEIKQKNIAIDKELEKNLEYKSILYTNGDELVKVVLEILDEILEHDSSKFVDEKKEDFLINKDDITFVGEIKGLSSAVQNKNISQLEVHIQNYFDKLQEEGKEEKVKGLLVINHQRNKPLEERQEIHEHQKDLATKYGSLIIETQTLLKIYEKYKLGKMTKEECKKLFEENIGLLEIKNN